MKFYITKLQAGLLLALLPAYASAEVTLPKFFTDNMLVQQKSELTVPVKTSPGKEVTVSPSWGTAVSVKADKKGEAAVKIKTPEAGGPYSLSVSADDETVNLINILSGELWLCSGQSNMEYPVNGWIQLMDYDNVIGNAHRPDIRLLQIKDVTAFVPQPDTEVTMGGWVECNPATMQDFSAIAYLFATRLHEELGVPVGVIDCAWGGTPAEAWTSAKALGAVPGFEDELKMLESAEGDRASMERLWRELYDSKVKKAYNDVKPFDKGKLQRDWKRMNVPGFWETTVEPGLDGVVYVQTAFDLTKEQAGSPVTLHLGAIDDEDITWLNGKEVARGSGYATERHYKIDPSDLKEGENVITIRITDGGGEGGFNGVPEQVYVETAEGNVSLAGDWGYRIEADFRKLGHLPVSVNSSSFPSVLYNAMLSPLHVMPVKGVLWYQGCANVGRAQQYEPLFKAMIKDWRSLWGYDMPFYFVQLAGFLKPQALQPDSDWAALRNAQSKALELYNTSMVTAIDLGNPADIHPRNKQEVARRLAETALTRDYGKEYDYKMPVCVSATPAGNKIVLKFDRELAPKSVAVTGFIVGDGKGNFAVATGKQTAPDTIELSAKEIAKPVVARYDWADYPGGNLYGKSNSLPVAPFATDK
ncbi:MAG: sialate O-acetylesterase [Muribaculaceae bacterium]|nr:sialate O-acetylesterase [Muribaculaceae bacterium]